MPQPPQREDREKYVTGPGPADADADADVREIAHVVRIGRRPIFLDEGRGGRNEFDRSDLQKTMSSPRAAGFFIRKIIRIKNQNAHQDSLT